MSHINIIGARVHNLKNINVTIPHNHLTVITGVSGSGKSSLAFDTLFAEGQRRYIDTLPKYVRYHFPHIERPDVDQITGLTPVIAIEQKTINRNPRSTVGTITEIYDYLRLLFAKVSEAYSYVSGEKMISYTEEQILKVIMNYYNNEKIYLLSPIIKNKKGHYKELFEQIFKKGFLNIRIDGEIQEIIPNLKLDRYENHSIEIVVDKLIITDKDEKRIKSSIHTTIQHGNGELMVLKLKSGEISYFNQHLACPSTGLSYRDPAPHNFSFNSPYGACPKCKGIGKIDEIDINLVIPNPELSIYQGGITPLGKYREVAIFKQLEILLKNYEINFQTLLKNFPKEAINDIIYGTTNKLSNYSSITNNHEQHKCQFEGISKYIFMQKKQKSSLSASKWANQFIKTSNCPECNGKRLNKEALHFFLGKKNIADLSSMEISTLLNWSNNIKLDINKKKIATEIIKEIQIRIKFLLDLGLNYLTLDRTSTSLSTGENQRVRLTTLISSQLVNVLYILDEPSIGLHHRDSSTLIKALKQLRDIGNSIIVIEHDKKMIMNADHIIDLGPKAGKLGGKIVFSGTFNELLKTNTLTASYFKKKQSISIKKIRKGTGKIILLKGANGNNLKNIDVIFPLGKFICITGVSGSGKSTLINKTLYPIISQKLYNSSITPLPYKSIEGLENIDTIISVDQSPIGKTIRSNIATYINVFSDIRNIFASLPKSKINGYKSRHFSFNLKEGYCEICKGNGYKTIKMNFLPFTNTICERCKGKKYNQATLNIQFKKKSIANILDMTINQAIKFFKYFPLIKNKLKILQKVGLGYICLGQSSTILSGGESQRVKLAAELSKQNTGKTLYILDEPTTGLHFEDIKILLQIINQLVDNENTIIIIEHNIDVIKSADHVIDIGPDGGKNGGEIIFTGTPEQLIKSKEGHTSKFLQCDFESNYNIKQDL